MLRRKNERIEEIRVAMRQGPGEVILTSLANKDELYEKARMFSTITLKPNCGIGKHEHLNESEIFYVVSGEAEYIDNDQIYEIKAGDVTICQSGHSHAITNKSNELCEIVALIILE